jgi:hypothetical protein
MLKRSLTEVERAVFLTNESRMHVFDRRRLDIRNHVFDSRNVLCNAHDLLLQIRVGQNTRDSHGAIVAPNIENDIASLG